MRPMFPSIASTDKKEKVFKRMVPLRPLRNRGFESFLWVVFAFSFWCSNKETVPAILTLLHIACRYLWQGPPQHDTETSRTKTTTTTEINPSAIGITSSAESIVDKNKDLWRRTGTSSSSSISCDPQGLFMSISLVPVLLHCIGGMPVYATVSAMAAFALPWDGRRRIPPSAAIAGVASCLVALAVPRVRSHFTTLHTEAPFPFVLVATTIRVSLFLFTWSILYGMVPFYGTLHGVLTRGECWVGSSLLAVVLTEFGSSSLLLDSAKNNSSLAVEAVDSLYATTAVAGVVGCGLACATVDRIMMGVATARWTEPIFIMTRLGYIVVVALGTVEGCFCLLPSAALLPFPKCLVWIWNDFLLAPEPQAHSHFILPRCIAELPRVVWLVYWFGIMIATIPLAPLGNAHAVVARKWFHFVAILLFVPASIAVPQLMSLSYAIALALLLLLESTRRFVWWLDDFYKSYLDTSKDESQDSTIVSHMALVAGCAIPLWLAQWKSGQLVKGVDESDSNTTHILLLPLWGIWTLGVGDSMGAVFGKKYGRRKWGYNQRTVEGSAAMLFSLTIVCCITQGGRIQGVLHWIPAVVFVTLLEAFTMQIDNIVLPLAGSAILCFR